MNLQYYTHSVRFKLTAFIGLLLLVSGSLFGRLSYWYTQDLLISRIHQQFAQVAETRKQILVDQINLHQDLSTSTANQIYLIDMLRTLESQRISLPSFQKQINRTLNIVKKNHRNFEFICILSPQGTVIASTNPNLLKHSFAASENFSQRRQEKYFGMPFRERNTYHALVSAPVFDPDTRHFLGIVMVRLNLQPFIKALTNTEKIGKSSEVVIGTPIKNHIHFMSPLRYAPQKNDFSFDQVRPMVAAAQGQEGVIISRDYRGTETLAAFQPVGYRNWGLVAKIDLAEVYAPILRLRNLLFATEFSILLIGLVGTFFWTRRFTQPIQVMDAAARQFTTGAFHTRVKVTSKDELGSLAESFNRMAEELENSYATLEQKVAERTAQLETAITELETFSYSISHDLRTPLRSIEGFSQVLLEEYTDKLDDRGKHYLGRVRQNSQQMADLFDEMVQLSMVARGEMTVEPVDLSAMAGRIAATLREQDPDRNVEFLIASNLTAHGDKTLLHTALHNLLDNAWKFTSKHPTSRIEFGLTYEQDQPVYFVKDDGTGFDMNYSEKLFQAFQRLHRIDEFPGNGVGLTLAARIIHRHGGKIWAQAEVERGATFYFTLNPALQPSKAPPDSL